jgi:hypothetical protein
MEDKAEHDPGTNKPLIWHIHDLSSRTISNFATDIVTLSELLSSLMQNNRTVSSGRDVTCQCDDGNFE